MGDFAAGLPETVWIGCFRRSRKHPKSVPITFECYRNMTEQFGFGTLYPVSSGVSGEAGEAGNTRSMDRVFPAKPEVK